MWGKFQCGLSDLAISLAGTITREMDGAYGVQTSVWYRGRVKLVSSNRDREMEVAGPAEERTVVAVKRCNPPEARLFPSRVL